LTNYRADIAIRHFQKCSANARDSNSERTEPAVIDRLYRKSLRGQRGFDVGINLENLVEAGDFENLFYAFLNTGQRESAAVFLDVLHRFDKNGKAGAVEISHFGKIDNQHL